MKQYHIKCGIGRARYVVNFHDGENTHKDGSPFYDVRIFRNVVTMIAFQRQLIRQGYQHTSP